MNERKPITDEMILDAFFAELSGRFPVVEAILKFCVIVWTVSIPMFFFLGGVPMVLFDLVFTAAVYFGVYRTMKRKRLQRLEHYHSILSIEDFLIRQDTCAEKITFEEFMGESYHLRFELANHARVTVTPEVFQQTHEGDPFITAVLRPDRLEKYGLKKQFRPQYWDARHWHRV